MAKSKYAPALFEVITNTEQSKGGGKLPIPKWWWKSDSTQGQASPVATGSEAPASPASGGAPDIPAAATESEPLFSSQATVAPGVTSDSRIESVCPVEYEDAPLVRVSGNRLLVSLNALNAAILGGTIILAVFGSYQLGHHFGKGSVPTAVAASVDPLEEALKQPPDSSVLKAATPPFRSGLTATARPPAPETANKTAPVTPVKQPAAPPAVNPPAPAVSRGSTRVVLESFAGGDRAAAEYAQKWLAEKGIPTTLETTRNGRVRLVSVAGFDYNSSSGHQECNRLCETVKELGPACGKALAAAKLPVYKFTGPMPVRMAK